MVSDDVYYRLFPFTTHQRQQPSHGQLMVPDVLARVHFVRHRVHLEGLKHKNHNIVMHTEITEKSPLPTHKLCEICKSVVRLGLLATGLD